MAIGCVGKANYVDKTKIVFIFKTMIALINATSTPTRGNPSVTYRQNSVNLIEDKSVLEWQIVSLVRYGIVEITVIVDAKETAIRDHLRDGSALQAKINYVSITDKDGVDKALHNIEKPNELIYIYGGVMLDLDWRRFIAYHKTSGASVSVLGTPTTKLFDCYCLNVDEHQIIRSIFKRERDDRSYCENLIVGGVFIITPALLSSSESLKEIDPVPELLNPEIEKGNAVVFRTSEFARTIETQDDALSTQRLMKNGVISAKNLSNKQSCIFLDRDGTLNKFGDFVREASMLDLMDDAFSSIRKINESKYLAVCITNQPLIGRKETTIEELHNIHNKLETLLAEQGTYLNDLFFCPHNPNKGYKGEPTSMRINCACRKPKIGMLLDAQKRYNIDFSSSWFVGDTLQDVQTGLNAGCRTILLTCGDPNYNKKFTTATPDFICSSLGEAIDTIIKP